MTHNFRKLPLNSPRTGERRTELVPTWNPCARRIDAILIPHFPTTPTPTNAEHIANYADV